MKHANAYKYTNKERLSTSDLWSQARKVWKNNEAAETGLGGSTEAEASWRRTVWSWGIERTFAAAIDLLSDVHDAFVFGANFSCGRSDDLPSNQADWAASRADIEDKTGKIIEWKRPATIDRRCDRAAGRTAEKSTWLLLWQKARPYDKTEIVTDSKGRILRVSQSY